MSFSVYTKYVTLNCKEKTPTLVTTFIKQLYSQSWDIWFLRYRQWLKETQKFMPVTHESIRKPKPNQTSLGEINKEEHYFLHVSQFEPEMLIYMIDMYDLIMVASNTQ